MKKISLFFIALLCMLSATSQIRGNEIRVVVSPDHTNWVYGLNEKSTFTVQVWKAQNLLPGVIIDYELGPEMYPTEVKKGIVLKDGSLKLQGVMKTPGFLRCKVKAHVNGRTYEGLATTAYAPEQLQPVTELPADFRDYWAKTLEKARTTPLNPIMTLMPERCTETDNVYQVSFQTKAGGGRFYGILSVPKAEGEYPALLRVPGAGVRPYSGDTYTAPGKVITLEVGIHGIPVNMQQSVYDALASGALNNYWTFGRDNQDAFYYNRVVLGVLRAVDFICSLPQYSGKALGVTGSSQGGALSVITAALDPRVTFFAAVHPALCDHEASLKKRACGWPHYFYYYGTPTDKEQKTARYYDVANFARCLNVPGWFSWGYNDEVCPPTSMYAAYNTINAPKELHPYLETGHYWYQEQWDEWLEWLRKQLGICASKPAEHSFIKVNADGQFIREGKPYYFVGANFWYGAILGSEGEGGNRERLHKELDFLKSIGVDNLRVLVGADGENGVKTRVQPSLQTAPGVYNDTILAGLDYFMNELRQRNMTAVLYLNNSWEWSGGYSVYLQWSGHGDAVVPAVDGWPAYMEYVQQFQQSDNAKALFANHVKYIVSRTNRYNQIKYVDDPTIMSWQVGNEPRAFSNKNKEPFARWMADVAAQIKSLDPNHMVSSGSEGSAGCEDDIVLYEKIHADSNIDYLNIHIWPYNWGWVKADSLMELLPQAKVKTKDYIDKHLVIAEKYRKPIVLEEFGFPRDGFQFSKNVKTTARDAYYSYVFDLIRQDREKGGLFAGCNFWAWGGLAKQTTGHVFWEKGDDYTGDPAQEQQGLNSVFATDSTTEIIKSENEKLK